MANELRDTALASKAWPYEEARKLLARYPDGAPAKRSNPKGDRTPPPQK